MNRLILLLSVATFSTLGLAEGSWPNRMNVIRAGDMLASEVEQFDESLHDVSAPVHLTQKVHHFEETVQEFVQLARTGTYQQAYTEFNHIRSDFKVIRDEMNRHPELMNIQKVSQEFQHTRTAYRSLDHEMFVWNTKRWPASKVEALKKDIEEMNKSHQ